MKKVAVLAGVVGLVGGGVGAAGVTYLENSELLNPVSVGTTTPVKVSNSNVKGDTEATKAFNVASGAVVSVINLQKQQATGAYSMFGETESKDSSSSDNDLETASEGSGVIYKKSGDTAYIVTNNHVVADSNALQVLLSDGTKLTATLVGTDDITDLAVLKVKADKIKDIAQFANSNEIKAGQSVIAIGSPMGSEYATSVTAGIISATKREVASTDESGNSLGTATVIQTDAPINSGNSGGALVNMAGQVVGINSMKLSSSGTGATIEGMGFAIPSNTVVNIINQLEKTGKIERPALGIKMLDLTSISVTDQEKTLKLPSSVKGGVVVMDTIDDTPAKTLGLEKYDVITKIDGKAVDGSGDLRDALYEHKIGDTIKVTYYRDGKEKTEPVNLTAKTSQLDD
ncbi:MAG: trypsin-like peptidase domain-containing protein [Lactobacillaceae bacterium]|nr:trypsin-like peptidase domain-containing protein [Lactobacillaceae bacterium]